MLFEKVKNLCESKQITIAQLERDVQVGNGTMQKWKKVSPSVDKLQKVADYFGVSTDFLLGRDVLSVQCQEIARAVDRFPPAKQELVKKYITMLQAS